MPEYAISSPSSRSAQLAAMSVAKLLRDRDSGYRETCDGAAGTNREPPAAGLGNAQDRWECAAACQLRCLAERARPVETSAGDDHGQPGSSRHPQNLRRVTGRGSSTRVDHEPGRRADARIAKCVPVVEEVAVDGARSWSGGDPGRKRKSGRGPGSNLTGTEIHPRTSEGVGLDADADVVPADTAIAMATAAPPRRKARQRGSHDVWTRARRRTQPMLEPEASPSHASNVSSYFERGCAP